MKSQLTQGAVARLSTLGITTIDQFMMRHRVDDQDLQPQGSEIERNLLRREIDTIEQESMSLFRHQGDRLIHDAARHTDVIVLGTLSDLRQGREIMSELKEMIEAECDLTFERGGGGESSTEWDLPIDFNHQP